MDLQRLSAAGLSRAIHDREVSCVEVMQAHLDRIRAVNPSLNAIVNLAPEDALLAQAHACDEDLARGLDRGWLHGLPIAIKDAADAKGFPTTRGCELLVDNMATRDHVMVERVKAAGAIVIGKTNTPEFGLGSHTFNTVFGATRNAWDFDVSAGGSSGGAAVALASGMLPVADGSDFMGSLRNPAGWNHVFGMRPTQGRVPSGPPADVRVDQLATEGPMARTVDDLGRLLATQAGHDPRLPLSLQSAFEWQLPRDPAAGLKGLRIGWLGDLGGYLAMEDGVLEACREGLRALDIAGAVVEEASLGIDLPALWECWLAWRRALAGGRLESLMRQPGARDKLKPEAQWEYDCSRELGLAGFLEASQARTKYFHQVQALLGAASTVTAAKTYDVLALPSAQVWPFPVEERWPKAIAGRAMDTYHRWMEVTIYATLAGLPAVCVPASFHRTKGWPMGLQLIGAYGADAQVLRVTAGYEAVRGEFLSRRPDL